MKTSVYSKIFKALAKELARPRNEHLIKDGDIGDAGNDIGCVIGKFIPKDGADEYSDFIDGLVHGISLANGTHDTGEHLWKEKCLCVPRHMVKKRPGRK